MKIKWIVVLALLTSPALHAQMSSVMDYSKMPKPRQPQRVETPESSIISELPPVLPKTNIQGFALGTPFANVADRFEKICKGILNPCKKEIKNAAEGKRAAFSDLTYTIIFDTSVLVKVIVHFPDGGTGYSMALKKFGVPTKVQTITLTNSFGATWDVTSAEWDMQDGAIVILDKALSFDDMSADIVMETPAEKQMMDAILHPKGPSL
jgi:hypothetical protein